MGSSFLFSIRLSFQVAAVAVVLAVPLGILVAYILAMKEFKGKGILDTILTLPLVLPPTVIGYYLVVLLGRNGLIGRFLYEATGWNIMFTWYAAATASFCVSFPLMVKTTRAAIELVDKNLIDASYTLGHSEWET
ncbi:MAG: molybdate ABC transporter permease subunit, partial [bacterium]